MEPWLPVRYEVLSILIASFVFFPSGCNPAPTSLPIVTSTPISSTAPSPTDTQQPTETTTPSATPLPTATTTPLVPGLGQVVFSESFEDNNFPFNIYGPSRIESEVLVLEREKGYISPPGMWPTGGIYGLKFIEPGTTILILFKASKENTYHIGLHNNKYGSDKLRRFVFNSGFATWDRYEGESNVKSWHTHQPHPDTWYYYSISRTVNGDIAAKLWERDNPETQMEFRDNVGADWGNLGLTLVIDFQGGTFMIDEYQELR